MKPRQAAPSTALDDWLDSQREDVLRRLDAVVEAVLERPGSCLSSALTDADIDVPPTERAELTSRVEELRPAHRRLSVAQKQARFRIRMTDEGRS